MGTNVTSNVFQKKLDEIFQNVQSVTGITDNMIIYGRSQEEHDVPFSQLSFNCEEEQSTIKYFKITIPTWRSIPFWTQMEFQRNITRP